MTERYFLSCIIRFAFSSSYNFISSFKFQLVNFRDCDRPDICNDKSLNALGAPCMYEFIHLPLGSYFVKLGICDIIPREK